MTIQSNLLLWGCESWVMTKDKLDKLEYFYSRYIRRILGIKWSKVIGEIISNNFVRGSSTTSVP